MRGAAADPTTPLWRAAQVFRLLSSLYALGFQIVVNPGLVHPGAGWTLSGLMLVVSAACAAAYLRGFGRRPAWVFAEVVVVLALMLSTELIASDEWVLANQSWPTTLWATNATVSAAILRGPIAGMLAGLAVLAASAVLKGYVQIDLNRATVVVELAVGLVVGMAAQTARRSHAELERAARMSAALQERERLSRHVHDGAIQVLALVARRGRELGGQVGELAELAGEQERALRRLVSSSGTGTASGADSTADLVELLRTRAGDGVSVSVPPNPVLMDSAVARELTAAAVNAIDNAAAHAGAGAHTFVLVEDLGDAVTVTVRDDGVGIAPGRLVEATRQGHVGVSKSIVGRLNTLGGSATLVTAPGCGTEWELTVPRRSADGRGDG